MFRAMETGSDRRNAASVRAVARCATALVNDPHLLGHETLYAALRIILFNTGSGISRRIARTASAKNGACNDD
jgi:hypothetical protein